MTEKVEKKRNCVVWDPVKNKDHNDSGKFADILKDISTEENHVGIAKVVAGSPENHKNWVSHYMTHMHPSVKEALKERKNYISAIPDYEKGEIVYTLRF